MAANLNRLRELLSGTGDYTRDGAPEPALLPDLLPYLPVRVLDPATALQLVSFGFARPGLGRDLLAATAARLSDLPQETRVRLLLNRPGLALYMPESLLQEASQITEAIGEPLHTMLRLKLLKRGVGDRARVLADAREALANVQERSMWTRHTLILLLELAAETEKLDVATLLQRDDDLPSDPEAVVAVAPLLKPANRRDLVLEAISRAYKSFAKESEGLCWSLTLFASVLPTEHQESSFADAILVA